MRFHWLLLGSLHVFALLLATVQESRAQQSYYNRVTTRSRVAATAPVEDRDELFTPPQYGPLALPRMVNIDGQSSDDFPTLQQEPPRPSAAPSRTYFPGLPSGSGPNRNYVNPGRLCVPGRRAMISGR